MIATGCRDAHSNTVAERIDVPTDTVTINTTLIERLEARVVDQQGKPVARRHLTVVAQPDSIALPYDNGGIQCRYDGVATVSLTSGPLHASMTVRCRIAERVGVDEFFTCMKVGDRPIPYVLYAYDAQGNIMTHARLLIDISDTNVVRLDHGMIVPLHAGRANIDAHAGRRMAGKMIAVDDTAAGAPRDSICRSSPAFRMKL